MAIYPISIANQNATRTMAGANAAATSEDANAVQQPIAPGEAAVFEKTDQMVGTTPKTYTRDSITLSEINKQVEEKLSSLRATVENLVAMQSMKTGEAQGLSYNQIMEKYDGKLKEFYQNLEVDDATRLKAQQEISEDGFWGVKQTAARTIEFAKALSGGDPSKIALLKNAIEEGYKAAEKSWGGELPEISKQTQAAVLKGLEEWANEATA
ncbi:hypothetical protein SDC9_13845 [bioreactor metagenome]|uniref:DUF5610 domain-containing protein n=1 Tax=bioreactor metagenome TaxID=1076179 RepID=A0A644TPD2_9ZZZZ|nr:hypothetical protein [Negativicutes bacterium]